jgi:hypothetical protein
MKLAWLVALAVVAGAQDTAESRILALEIAWNQAVQQRVGKRWSRCWETN